MEVRKIIVTLYDLLCMLLGKVCLLGTVIFTIIVAVIKSDVTLAICGICVGIVILRLSYRSNISKDLYINGIYEFEIKKQQRQERRNERKKKRNVKLEVVYKDEDTSTKTNDKEGCSDNSDESETVNSTDSSNDSSVSTERRKKRR